MKNKKVKRIGDVTAVSKKPGSRFFRGKVNGVILSLHTRKGEFRGERGMPH